MSGLVFKLVCGRGFQNFYFEVVESDRTFDKPGVKPMVKYFIDILRVLYQEWYHSSSYAHTDDTFPLQRRVLSSWWGNWPLLYHSAKVWLHWAYKGNGGMRSDWFIAVTPKTHPWLITKHKLFGMVFFFFLRSLACFSRVSPDYWCHPMCDWHCRVSRSAGTPHRWSHCYHRNRLRHQNCGGEKGRDSDKMNWIY